MIVVDTNVISEMMKSSPSIQVISWLDQQDPANLYITTITIAELSYGIHALPIGNRRTAVEHAFHQVIDEAFKHRVLSFDESSAQRYGVLMGHRKSLGRPLSILDGQIAAISYVNQYNIATRNTRDFVDCGLTVINPFG